MGNGISSVLGFNNKQVPQVPQVASSETPLQNEIRGGKGKTPKKHPNKKNHRKTPKKPKKCESKI